MSYPVYTNVHFPDTPTYTPTAPSATDSYTVPLPTYPQAPASDHTLKADVQPIPKAPIPPDSSSSDDYIPNSASVTKNGVPYFSKMQQKVKLFAGAMLIGSVALAILGIVLLAVGSGPGILSLVAAVPLLYVGYNAYRVNQNLGTIAKDPAKMTSTDATSFDPQKVKQALKENTLLFDWVIDKGTDYFLKAAPAA